MAGSLEGVLARVPGLGGYVAGQQMGQRDESQKLAQLGALQQIMQRQQQAQAQQAAMQEQAQLQGVVQQAGGDPRRTIEALMKSGNPKAIALATKMQESFVKPDAQMEQARALQAERIQAQADMARQRSEDQRLSQAERNQARADMIRLAASLRPAPQQPQPRNLQLTTDESGNQLIVNPDGTTRPLTREDGAGVRKPIAADKPMTEFQGKAALYGTRSAQSDKVLRALEDTISKEGLAAGQAAGTVGNYFLSSEQQRVNQAQRDFVNAVLRQESGAVISDAEFENAKKQYFPQPGDDQKAVAQKRANRQLAIKGFSRMSGPKGTADIDAIINEPLLPGVSATSPTPQQASGQIGGKVAKIATDAEYDALPSGATFVGPDGKTRKKP